MKRTKGAEWLTLALGLATAATRYSTQGYGAETRAGGDRAVRRRGGDGDDTTRVSSARVTAVDAHRRRVVVVVVVVVLIGFHESWSRRRRSFLCRRFAAGVVARVQRRYDVHVRLSLTERRVVVVRDDPRARAAVKRHRRATR